jgi:hypothetical protein
MREAAIDQTCLIRICEYARKLHQLHRHAEDAAIDHEFNAVCRAIWGYTLDDFHDDSLSKQDHAWLDGLTRKRASAFAIQNGYDLADLIHGGIVTDWWGFAWMILAEKRGLLTPEARAAAWRRYDRQLLAKTNVIAVIRPR